MCVRKLSALFDGLSGAAPGLNVGFHLVSWEDLCLPHHHGGLGFKHLAGQNEAFFNETSVPICDRSYTYVGAVATVLILSGVVLMVIGLAFDGVAKFWKGMSFVWHDVHRNLVWNIGDGSQARFWLDPWLGNGDPYCGIFRCGPVSCYHQCLV
ncbi:hypothetical protein V6N13_103352 [Hibiscus sabdariffa]